MKYGVLGTGTVGQTVGGKLVELGNEVMMGSREAGGEKATAWVAAAGDGASEGTFADAAAFGERLVNATGGMVSLSALEMAGEANLTGKTLIDISNSLDFSNGMPPTLAVCNDDSVGEQIQRAYPETKVVKSLNTVTASVMVNPAQLAESSAIFVSGDDEGAKAEVKELLESFGWLAGDIVDLGDITSARGAEMILPLWVRLMGATGTAMFNIRIVQA